MGIHDAVVAASTDMQGALLVDKNGIVINEMTGCRKPPFERANSLLYVR